MEDDHVGLQQEPQAQLQLTALLEALQHAGQGAQQGPQEVFIWGRRTGRTGTQREASQIIGT